MPLGAGEIATYRTREKTQSDTYKNKCALRTLGGGQVTINGVLVKIWGETGNAQESLHKDSIQTAVKDVIAAGHALPTLEFYLTSSEDVPNVAMKTYDVHNNPAPIIFLGPKMWSKNPQLKDTSKLVAGGIGEIGPRGIANQAYDGTTVWFGNPKQKAQGATIVIHELGHILHEIKNSGAFWAEQQALEGGQPSPNGRGWQAASVDVSNYAGNNQLEFVAEVFAGRMIGKNYGDAVNSAYAALGGP